MEKSLRRVFEVGLILEGQLDKQLRPGLSARIEVIDLQLQNVTVVPRSAIWTADGHTTVLTKDGQTLEVSLSNCNAFECVIDKGVAADTSLQRGAS